MSNNPQSRYSIAPNAHLRHQSLSGGALISQSSPALVNRINEKKQELKNLISLRDLSGNLASQMQQLEERLRTLSEGTEAVAEVLSNWHNVIRAIAMASTKTAKSTTHLGKDPFIEPTTTETDRMFGSVENEEKLQMPHTLVRIPGIITNEK